MPLVFRVSQSTIGINDKNKIMYVQRMLCVGKMNQTWEYFPRQVHLIYAAVISGPVNERRIPTESWLIAKHELQCHVIDHSPARNVPSNCVYHIYMHCLLQQFIIYPLLGDIDRLYKTRGLIVISNSTTKILSLH